MVVTFRAYSKDQILTILQERLLALPYIVFQQQALELCARKVAAASGDMRKALCVCRSVFHSCCFCNLTTVRIDHMVLALSKTFRSPIVDNIQSLPQHQQITLCSAAKFFRRGKKDTTVGELNKYYIDICKSALIPPVGILEFLSMCRVLNNDQGLFKIGQARDDKLKRVTLRVDEADISFALQEDDRDALSFLFESVEPGLQASSIGRYSVVGAQQSIEIVAKENMVTIINHEEGHRIEEIVEDPMTVPRRIMEGWVPQHVDELPEKIFVIHWVRVDQYSSVDEAYNDGMKRLKILVSIVHDIDPPKLPAGLIKLYTRLLGLKLEISSMTNDAYKEAVLRAKEHILAGDIFQIVLSQHFERRTFADPFEIYKALRIVNPSPYMTYLQLWPPYPGWKCLLNGKITNQLLAGTIRRGKTSKEDLILEKELLADEKQCAEHIMLVDLGRNDVGKVYFSFIDLNV
ncbi:hypothetical protein REPUB_Repub11eG0151000 [Reevesia pubescens]